MDKFILCNVWVHRGGLKAPHCVGHVNLCCRFSNSSRHPSEIPIKLASVFGPRPKIDPQLWKTAAYPSSCLKWDSVWVSTHRELIIKLVSNIIRSEHCLMIILVLTAVRRLWIAPTIEIP